MLREIIIAFQSYRDAHFFIKNNRLWKWIIIPGLIYMLMFFVGIYLFYLTSNTAIKFILQASGIKAWLDNMHDSWLNFIFILGQIMVHLILLLFYFSLFKFLFLIIGSPVFAYLSEKTESIIEGKEYPFSFKKLITDIIRGVRIALRNIVWQSVYLLAIFILSFIPIAGWIAPMVALFMECYYLGFSMLDYNSERNNLSYSQSVEFVGRHKGLAIGNGMVFYLMHTIPFIGWIFAPSYAVVAATLSILKARKKQILI